MTQKLEDALKPAHKLVEKPVVVGMYLVDELVEIVFMAGTQVNEGLNCLIRICRDLLPLARFNHSNSVVNEHGKVGNTVVDACRLVDTNKRFIENGEQISEQMECGGLSCS